MVSEAPGKASLLKNKYWTGSGGKLLRCTLKELGIKLEEWFYLTDIVKCWPNKDNKGRSPTKNEVRNCSRFLLREINELNPKIIISLGKAVPEFLLGKSITMKESHGKIFKVNDRSVLVLYHPSNINLSMNVDEYKKQLKNIFKRLLKRNINI